MADHESYIDVCDLLMLVICLEYKENGCSPAELRGAKRDALHAEGSLYGTEANVPQVESILALEGVLWDGALVGQLQKNVVKVKCGHLKDK